METVLAFLGMVLPLTMSPGPATVALAGLGMRSGVVAAIPFYTGMMASCAAIALAAAFGLNELFLASPVAYDTIRYLGIAYIVYLAVRIYRSAPPDDKTEVRLYGLRDGLLLSVLNAKYYVVVSAVFSQFLLPGASGNWIVVTALIALVALSQATWLVAGAGLRPLMRSALAFRIQSLVFSASLLAVAVYLLLRK
ncbi:MAG: LysE family translocator [Alphaproteobacteria bacterium]